MNSLIFLLLYVKSHHTGFLSGWDAVWVYFVIAAQVADSRGNAGIYF